MTKEELYQLTIEAPDESKAVQIKQNWDSIAKPLDSMGSFETLSMKIGAIQRTENPQIAKRAVLVLCADNGIVEERVSQSMQEVTLQVAKMLGQGKSSVCKLAAASNTDVIPVDIGINSKEEIPGVWNEKIAEGTRNFLKAPAMTEEETLAAIEKGICLVQKCQEMGYQILALGEMGIGNTTTSSALAAALLKVDDVRLVTGRGAGLSDQGFYRKQQVIQKAIQKYSLYAMTPLEMLRSVGGLDLAGLVGICIGGAIYHLPIVLDGLISAVAANVAEQLCRGVREYLIASHQGKEPAARLLLAKLSLSAILHAELALGEGTGAVLLFPLLDSAFSLYQDHTTFHTARITPYERY